MAHSIVRKVVISAAAPKPVGPYSQAIIVDHTMYISGCIGLDPETNDMVTGGLEPEDEQVFKNMGAILQQAGISYKHVVKTTVLLADINDFPTVVGMTMIPTSTVQLIQIHQKYFCSGQPPARSTFAVKDLPKGAKIEVEAIAVVGNIQDVN